MAFPILRTFFLVMVPILTFSTTRHKQRVAPYAEEMPFEDLGMRRGLTSVALNDSFMPAPSLLLGVPFPPIETATNQTLAISFAPAVQFQMNVTDIKYLNLIEGLKSYRATDPINPESILLFGKSGQNQRREVSYVVGESATRSLSMPLEIAIKKPQDQTSLRMSGLDNYYYFVTAIIVTIILSGLLGYWLMRCLIDCYT